ncbi:MAG: hypothetical protein GY796_00335 [Chloroflexi bacterium]|nr:hypothetical protein [Chloroflexota bacterium]
MITAETYFDKIHGAWQATMVANHTGLDLALLLTIGLRTAAYIPYNKHKVYLRERRCI